MTVQKILTAVLLFCSLAISGQTKLVMTPLLQDAYRDISSLRLREGQSKVNLSKLKDPENAMTYYIENYIDFFTLFIKEEEADFKKLQKNRNLRLDKIRKADTSSPYYLFCQAEIILQWATIKLKFDDKINAAGDVYEAYRLLEKNKSLHPDFLENNKSLSIIHALAESVPSWVRKVMGVKGSVDLGTREIMQLAERAASENHLFKEEIVAIYSYILFYSNNQKEEAYRLFDRFGMDHRKNPLITFLKATMAHKTGRNDMAIRILEERPRSQDYLPFHYLDFLYGKFKLCRLDKGADIHIRTFLANFRGRHYTKEAWQKLGWYHLAVDKNNAAYKEDMRSCVKSGYALIDEDIQANKEAKSGIIPNDLLLRARLLYDGGYYTKCYDLLVVNGNKFVNAIHDGEYYYRLARVSDALKNYKDALEYYDLTILKSDPGKYYACSSALQAGLICEGQKKYGRARSYFEKCLNLDPAGYTSSLHQKAKSGLSRIKGK